jgi:hypothetical protein
MTMIIISKLALDTLASSAGEGAAMRENLEGFKEDLLRLLAICNDPTRDVYVKLMGFIGVLEAFGRFADVWDKKVHDQLAPVLAHHCKELGNVINGRRSKTFTRAPRKGKQRPLIDDVQEGVRAAAAMHFLVPVKGKKCASRLVARWLGGKIDPETIDYWRDQCMSGPDEAIRELFDVICRAWTAKIADPEQRAKSLIEAHKKRQSG